MEEVLKLLKQLGEKLSDEKIQKEMKDMGISNQPTQYYQGLGVLLSKFPELKDIKIGDVITGTIELKVMQIGKCYGNDNDQNIQFDVTKLEVNK